VLKHANWKEPVEFMHHCGTKWATFLLSLRDLGRGFAALWGANLYSCSRTRQECRAMAGSEEGID
jgi:hypothetical protein